jgi:uncharacterized membrane protein YcaP (DUF421 family)
MADALFQGWFGILRVLVFGTLAYFGLVAMLRVSGKRTLAKLNAFDLIVTVALGSTLATVLLTKDVGLVEGLAAFALLIALQFAVTWTSVRVPRIARLVRSEPTLLMRNGEVLHAALRRERVTESELMSVIRTSGSPDPDDVAAVILESDGSFSVIPTKGEGDGADYARAGLG